MINIFRKIEDGKLILEVDNSIYSDKALLASAYNISDKACVFLNKLSDGKTEVVFMAKDENKLYLEEYAKQYCLDVIDQQLRIDLEATFGNYRDMIVRQAFSPITHNV